MRKPLELKVRDTTYLHSVADSMSQHKRFTDAELAAEYWREGREFLKMAGSSGDILDRYYRWATINRFACLPHYDEPTDTPT